MPLKRYTFLLLLVLAFACKEEENIEPAIPLTPEQINQRLDDLNNTIKNVQELEIEGYIHRKKYDMTRTGTGLRYEIYHRGEKDSNSVINGQVVQVRYELRLLNDVVCYSNIDSGAVAEFVVNTDDVESGLHEAVQYMHTGDKARVIIHSALAHGLLGDRDCVPPSSPVLFDLELIAVK